MLCTKHVFFHTFILEFGLFVSSSGLGVLPQLLTERLTLFAMGGDNKLLYYVASRMIVNAIDVEKISPNPPSPDQRFLSMSIGLNLQPLQKCLPVNIAAVFSTNYSWFMCFPENCITIALNISFRFMFQMLSLRGF